MTADLLPGRCHRCGEPGHWADGCGWLAKAATYAIHLARIDSLRDRYTEMTITDWQKSQFIKDENRLWYDGKVPAPIR